MDELVSILIPAFNAERWIAECVESALDQTWPRREIIVVDDGSDDQTFDVAMSFAPDIQVVKQENKGACTARNHALSRSRGAYIQWLDADDVLAPDKVERQMEFAGPGHTSRVLLSCPWGGFKVCRERSRFAPNLLWNDLDPAEWLFRKIDGGIWMACETWLVSRHLTEISGPWNEYLARDQDGEYFSRVIRAAELVKFVPDARVFVRERLAGSITSASNVTDAKRESTIVSLKSYVATLLEVENSERTRKACLKLLNRWPIYFFPERTDLLEELKTVAADLGGCLSSPELKGKYRLIQKLFGWKAAKRSKVVIPYLRDVVVTCWERILCLFSGSKSRQWGHRFK